MTLWCKLVSALNLSLDKVKWMVSVWKSGYAWVSHGEQTPHIGDHKSRLIKSRSSVSRITMKWGMTQLLCYSEWRTLGLIWGSTFLSHSALQLAIQKQMSVTDVLCIHTHTGGVEGCSAVSDFQLIHKHKRPLCLASTTLPLLVHRSGRVPVQRPPKVPPSSLHPDSFTEILKFLQLL